VRKIFGGGMRQAGYLAAAGIYAIHHNIERLKQDHLKAKEIDKLLKSVTWVKSVLPVQTNIIIFSCQSNLIADKLMLHLEQHQVKANKVAADAIRFVFHLDVSDDDFDRLLKVLVGFEV
jgi:threonine aldolase